MDERHHGCLRRAIGCRLLLSSCSGTLRRMAARGRLLARSLYGQWLSFILFSYWCYYRGVQPRSATRFRFLCHTNIDIAASTGTWLQVVLSTS